MLAWPDTSTCCPRRVAARAASANKAPIAAYMPLQNGDFASGPVSPYGVTFTTLSDGDHAAAVAASITSRDWMTTSADDTSARSRSRSRGSSSRTPRLFALSAIHSRPRSGPASSCRNGGTERTGSPAGGSTLTTFAPRSARMRTACATADAPQMSSPAISMTRRPSSSSITPGLAAGPGEDLRPGLRLHERLALRDLIRVEPIRRVDAIDRIHRPHEVLLETVRDRRVDAHAALEADVHAGPLGAPRGDAL